MIGRSRVCALLLISVLAVESGCSLFHRKTKSPAAPARPAAIPAVAPPAPQPQLRPIEEPQVPPPSVPAQSPAVMQPPLDKTPPPPVQPRKKPRRSSPRPAKVPEPIPAVAEPAKADPAEARLGDVLPEAQRRNLGAMLDENLQQARQTLNALQNRPLTKAQAEARSRIRSFVRQAEDARATNITAAVQLSHRAAVLARDLNESLR